MLDDGAGEDLLNGGRGADKFIVRPDDDDDVIADFNRSEGDKIVLDDNATQVWFYNFSPGGSVPDFTVLYDAALNGDVYAILIGSHTLVSSDFESAGGSVSVTEITLAAPANPLSGGGANSEMPPPEDVPPDFDILGEGPGDSMVQHNTADIM